MTISLVGVAAICALLFAEGKTQATSKPVSLGLLMDASAHQKSVIGFERDAVNLLADRFASQATESLVIRYGDEVKTLQEWSALEPELRRVAARIELDAEGGKNRRTLLYDAIDAALGKFGAANNANAKVLLIIGEGNDAGSLAKYSQIKARAKSANLQCSVLLVADHNLMGGRIRHFGFDLYDLASATRGKAYDNAKWTGSISAIRRSLATTMQGCVTSTEGRIRRSLYFP